MKKAVLIFVLSLLFIQSSLGQKIIELPLWEGNPPQSNGVTAPETLIDSNRIANISIPTIRVFIPSDNLGVAVIDCSGGGYAYLQVAKDGVFYMGADWFNTLGVVYIYLKYRTPHGHACVPLADAEQAMRVVRSHASEWGIKTDKIGIMGTSAGGHLASTLATHFHEDTRPNFQILMVPVISMVEDYKHTGSCNQLLGRNATKDLMLYYSSDLHVTAHTPNAFIVMNDDDNVVSTLNGTSYYQALRHNNISAEMHVFPKGGHCGMFYNTYSYKDEVLDLLERWLLLKVK